MMKVKLVAFKRFANASIENGKWLKSYISCQRSVYVMHSGILLFNNFFQYLILTTPNYERFPRIYEHCLPIFSKYGHQICLRETINLEPLYVDHQDDIR